MAEAKPRRRSKAKPPAAPEEAAARIAAESKPPPPPPSPGSEDAPPNSGRRRGPLSKKEQKARELEEIQRGLEDLLITMPGMYAVATDDHWLKGHVFQTGPPLAAKITAECDRNDAFRRGVLIAVRGESYLGLAIAGFAYARPIAVHYGLAPQPQGGRIPVRPVRFGRKRRQEAQQAAQRQVAAEQAAYRARQEAEAYAASQAASAAANGVPETDEPPPAYSVDEADNVVGVPSDGDLPPAETV